jgi:hypothetical protein
MSAQDDVHKNCGCGCGTFTCGCCAGVEPLTPQSTVNRPGLASLVYRAGTHGSFLATMSAQLSMHEFPAGIGFDGNPREAARPLGALSKRASTDPSVAMLDAWAAVGDVLTFYQERIANEGYLRTATEMRSMHELARLVGYRPRPGVAASLYLAYTIDSNTPEEVVIPRGARSQSVPGPGEAAQSFETGAELRARARWNDLKLRLEQPQTVDSIRNRRAVYLKGVTTGLLPGDPLLVVIAGTPSVMRILEVLPDNDKQVTLVKAEAWSIASGRGEPRTAPRLDRLQDVLRRAPQGAVARGIVDGVRSVIARAAEAEPGNALPRAMVRNADQVIAERIGSLSLPARNLRSWAERVREELAATVQPEAATPAPAAPLPAAAPRAAKGRDPIADVVNLLVRPGSRPRANPLDLPRSLDADFSPTSDAGLKLLGAVAPHIKPVLEPALSGQIDPKTRQTIEVHAFRVRAGVFGRNTPKRQEITQGNRVRTEVIGEWPIVEITPFPVAGNDDRFQVTRIVESERAIYLDTHYDGIVPDSWVFVDSSAVVIDPSTVTPTPAPLVLPAVEQLITRATGVRAKISRSEYGMSADTVRLDLAGSWLKIGTTVGTGLDQDRAQADVDRDFRVVRGTAVYARSEKLELALEPIEEEFCDGSAEEKPAELDGLYPDLEPGRFVVVSGDRADLGDAAVVRASEALMVRAVRHDVRAADKPVPWTDEIARRPAQPPDKLTEDRPHTFVWFDKPLSYCYRRATVSIRANVVKATHGETRNETLGSGDASRPQQSFTLKQFPLTFLAAPTATGADSTLEVFVNDVRWHEKPSFVMGAPGDHIYVTRADEAGKNTVIFGNGIEGSRLPTGAENVKAVYRNGIGKPGNVRPGQVSLLVTRPLGVKEVINPLRAAGGADCESRDQIRRNSPNAVMALDRLVSVRDYADFARAFAGIGKAAAAELPDGSRTVVHVTIAGSDDVPIDRDSDLFLNLRRALRRLGDPFQPIELALRELLILVLSAKLRIHPDHQWPIVAAAVRARLFEQFGFERRELAYGIAASEVFAAIQAVPGVLFVDLDSFGAVSAMVPDDEAEGGLRPRTPEEIAAGVTAIVTGTVQPAVIALPARRSDDGFAIFPAQLAVLLPDAPDTVVLNRIE